MSAFLLGANPTVADTTAQFPIGTEIQDPRTAFSGNVIRYVKANGTIAVNAAVRQDYTDETNEPHAMLATSATGQNVQGVSIAALSSSATSGNVFGWITVKGKASVLTAAVAAAGSLLVTTATAGTLDDFATNTDVTAAIIASFSGPPIVSIDSTAATDGTLSVFIG